MVKLPALANRENCGIVKDDPTQPGIIGKVLLVY
jgi:hypothetical protein